MVFFGTIFVRFLNKNKLFIHSLFFGRSLKMSDVSKSLRSLTKNEQIPRFFERIARFFELIAHSLIFSQKMIDLLRKPMSEFPTLLFYWREPNIT